MESLKIAPHVKAKSVILDNGVELTYCELGEGNDEVIISGAFYFHTWMPVMEGLAKKFHVYGIVMRMDGPITCPNADGTPHWNNQWGEDLYLFAQALGIKKFHYLGKCHGVEPGWWMVKNHPEMLDTFCSFYMVPHLLPRTSNIWMDTLRTEGPDGLNSKAMRNQDRIVIKQKEIATLGNAISAGTTGDYADSPEKIWDTLEECEECLKTTQVPICCIFGTDDIVFHDHFDSTIKAMQTINRAKFVFLQGERHLLEIDCPERLVSEACYFISESKQVY